MKTDLFLNRLLSFTSLALAWIAANSLKFYLYGIEGFGYHWNIKEPTHWQQTKAFCEHVFGGYSLLFLVTAIAIDYFLWPYFFQADVREIHLIQS